MIVSSIRFAAAVALGVALAIATPAAARAPDAADLWNGPAIAWRDMPTGVREASTSGKRVILLFHASWCTSCKRYREVWKDQRIVDASRNFVMILVDVDKDPDANSGFSPDGTYVPRTLFLNSEGDILSQYRGKDPEFPHTVNIDSPDELLALMQRAAADTGNPAGPETAPDRRADANN